MVRFTRRQMLIGGGASVVIAGAGAARAVSGTNEEFLAEFIRHALPTEAIAPGATEAFAADYLRDETYEDFAKIRRLMLIARLIGISGLDQLMGRVAVYKHFKRRVATAFMLASTFFQRETPDEPVEYVGLNLVCAGNPFARFA